MGIIKTNRTSLVYGVESSLGTAGTLWKKLEFNDLTTWGKTIVKTPRDPISSDRSRRKGATTDQDSSVEFTHDLTREVFQDFIEAFMFVSSRYPYSGSTTRVGRQQSGTNYQQLSSVDSTNSFDHTTITTAMTAGRLVYVRGFTGSAMNGIHEVDTGSSATSTVITSASSLTDETPGNTANATMEIAGHRPASGETTWTFATKTLTFTTLDPTTLGLSAGQILHIGGLTSATQFSEGVGYGRISSITSSTIVFDRVTGALATADGDPTGETVDLLFGSFIRNVDTTASDFLERSFQFELTMPNLGSGGATRYQYSIGNYANQVTFNLPLSDKSTIDYGFIGTDTEDPTASQKAGADTPAEVVEDDAYNTGADIARLRVMESDETGLTTCFKSCSVTINNQVAPEKCLGTLGATDLNIGTMLIDIEAEVLLTNESVITAITDNDTVGFDFVLKNDDGAICGDIPAATLGGGQPELPRNESVKVSLTGEAHKDATLGYVASFSLIPAVP